MPIGQALHGQLAVTALAALILLKPLATSLAEAKKLAAIVEKTGKVFLDLKGGSPGMPRPAVYLVILPQLKKAKEMAL